MIEITMLCRLKVWCAINLGYIRIIGSLGNVLGSTYYDNADVNALLN